MADQPNVKYINLDDIEISDAASATGLAASGQVRMFESPHSGSSYLLKEMGFRVGRKHSQTLRRIALIAGGALPGDASETEDKV